MRFYDEIKIALFFYSNLDSLKSLVSHNKNHTVMTITGFKIKFLDSGVGSVLLPLQELCCMTADDHCAIRRYVPLEIAGFK